MSAFESNILSNWVINCKPDVFVTPHNIPFEVFSFDGSNFPVFIVIVDRKTGIVISPGFEWDPEFTDITGTVVSSLRSVISSPEGGFLGPWAIIMVVSPWVSH